MYSKKFINDIQVQNHYKSASKAVKERISKLFYFYDEFYDYDPTFQVEDHEVECDPRFRLFLHTTVEPHMVPPHLAAYSSVIYFQRSRADIEETLLDRFIYQEKSKLEEERVSLLQVKRE